MSLKGDLIHQKLSERGQSMHKSWMKNCFKSESTLNKLYNEISPTLSY